MRIVKRDLTEGSLARGIWYLALPSIVANTLMDVFNIVDMIFVGRLGPSAIAAVSIGGIVMGLVRMIAMGISTGTVAMVSRFVGAGDHRSAEEVITQTLFLNFFFSAVIALLGHIFAETILRAMGATEEILTYAVAYLRIMCYGSITIFLTMTLSAGLRGFGDAVTPMHALALASLLNIGLDPPLLIFGIGPFPRLEVAGSAVATVLARLIGAIVLLAALLLGKQGIGFGWIRSGLRWKMIWRIVKIGSYSSLRMLSMNLSRIILVRFVSAFGAIAIAAYGIGMRLRLFVMMPGMGFANAASVMVGQNLGAKKPERSEKSAWIAVAFYSVFLVIVTIVFLFFPRQVIGVFNTQADMVELGSSFLRLYAFSLLFGALAIILGRGHDGAGDTASPMFITGFSLIVIGIPLAWGFSQLWGITGIWISIVSTEILQGIAMALSFRLGRWKLKNV